MTPVKVTVITHRRVRETGAGRARAGRLGAARRRDAALHRRRGREAHRSSPARTSRSAHSRAPTSASCSAATARSSPPCASTRAPARPCSRSTTARSGSSPPSTPTGWATSSTARSPASSRRCGCPTITVGRPDGQWTAINDISVHRKPGMRVADLAYGLAGEEIGRVRCDGLVVSTPAGSTGYNLANAGPILAWGVRGYVVSFIAPHSLTARALVVGARGPADDQQRLARGARRGPRRRPAGLRAAGRRGHPRGVRARARRAGADAGGELLPPVARAVRAAGALAAPWQAPRASPARRRNGIARGEGSVAGFVEWHYALRGLVPSASSSDRTRPVPLGLARASVLLRTCPPLRARCDNSAQLARRTSANARLRRDPVVDLPMCWKSSASRTCS